MLLGFVLCHALFLPVLGGINKTISNVTNIVVINGTSTEKVFITEGGPAVQSTSITLPAQAQDTVLPGLDKVLGVGKSVQQPSTSNIKPRKGAVYEEKPTEAQSISKKTNDTHQIINATLVSMPNNSSEVHQKNITRNVTIHTQVTKEANKTTTTLHHKPLTLVSEDLDRISQNIKDEPSRKPPVNTGRHPGMIMPVVITILVVPMFAMLGYMALQRGKEAWKNRHYKRMDFLLDGMYNE